ncbi:MAG: hypothetical protein JWM92_552 [Candidatus Nomurabacteria bacterium]|nr:hypothetical protein [Candidatus Nomurabacteria bacterium]
MKVAESYYVELTKGEVSAMFTRICLEKLKSIIPEIDTMSDTASIALKLVKYEPDFRLEFSCSISSSQCGVIKKVQSEVILSQGTMIDEIINEALMKKGIKRAVNLNTPMTDLEFSLGTLNTTGTKNGRAISFSFSCNYDSADDYQ